MCQSIQINLIIDLINLLNINLDQNVVWLKQ